MQLGGTPFTIKQDVSTNESSLLNGHGKIVFREMSPLKKELNTSIKNITTTQFDFQSESEVILFRAEETTTKGDELRKTLKKISSGYL